MDIAPSILRRVAFRSTLVIALGTALAIEPAVAQSPGAAKAKTSAAATPPATKRAETARYLVDAIAGTTLKFALPAGPRAIVACELRIPTDDDTRDRWAKAKIRLQWDDAVAPAVSLTAAEFWGLDRLDSASNTDDAWDRVWPRGARAGAKVAESGDPVFSALWPMGYQRQGFLVVETPEPCRGEIRLRSALAAPTQPLYFHARTFRSRDARSKTGETFALTPANTKVRGEWIGLRAIPAQSAGSWILRADDREVAGAAAIPFSLAADPSRTAFRDSLRLEFSTSATESSPLPFGSSATCFWRSEAP